MLQFRTILASAVAVVALSSSGMAAAITPTFDTFGTLAGATFGGSGIPNDAVAITEITADGGEIITIGLTAHQRFSEPPVTNNGAGVFYALPGGFPGSPSLARWNFAYYISVANGAISDFMFELLYDFDPGAGTDDSVHGVLDLTTLITGFFLGDQDSQNLGFSYLDTPAPPFVIPPTFPSFDPNAVGEYTFALRVSEIGTGFFLGESAIQVNTVPEPLSASLFGIGALGLVIGGVRRRRKAHAENTETNLA